MDSGFDNAANYYINVGHVTLFACVSISPAVKDGLVALNCGSELPLTILEVVSVPLIQWYTYQDVSIGTYFYLPNIVVAVLNPQRLLVYINVLWDSCAPVFLLSASVSLPKLPCSSNVLAFSNTLVTGTGKMFMKIYTFLTILIFWETHLIACPSQKSSLFINVKDSTLVLLEERMTPLSRRCTKALEAQDCGIYTPTIC